MAVGITITLNKGLYLRDPQQTTLGQKIIKEGILLIHEIGFEAFNFKKLAKKMESTEASIYRYFVNKHLLLIYLVAWYWEWVTYLIDIRTLNIESPQKRLKIIIETLVFASKDNASTEYVNENILHQLIIAEGAKAYHTKEIDKENKEGFFLNYKKLVTKVSEVILEVKPNFPYSRALASNIFEMASNHVYFAEHLPRLTDISIEGEDYSEVEKMIEFFTFSLLNCEGYLDK